MFDCRDRSKSKESFDVLSEGLVGGEPSEPHHSSLGVASIEELVLTCDTHDVIEHGGEINQSMLIKPAGQKHYVYNALGYW